MARIFHRIASIVLILTGVAKLWSARGTAKILNESDALLNLNYRQLFLIIGCVEVALGLYLLLSNNLWRKTVLLALLSGNFLLYRLASQILGVKTPCPCLGRFAEWLRLSSKTVSLLMLFTSAFLFVGSLFVISRFAHSKPGERESCLNDGTADVEQSV